MARKFPAIIQRVVAEGHELACHGDLHRDFTTLSPQETAAELKAATETLRMFGPVQSFRAPYLRFPVEYLRLLVKEGLCYDSSIARYKFGRDHRASVPLPGLIRVSAAATSSVLRLPAMIRGPWLRALKPPLMLFVHPWEAVDFRNSQLRWDCRFRTGMAAVNAWRSVIVELQRAGAKFERFDEIAGRHR
jgi:peptidoglycan/xylan/chitin deacetylase (PgdA/CDA1 family)